jgi:hypothetical protein
VVTNPAVKNQIKPPEKLIQNHRRGRKNHRRDKKNRRWGNNLTPTVLLFKFIETLQFNKMRIIIPLEYGKYYHIYNRGINGEDLFRSNENHEYFLRLYEKYMEVVIDTYAWCLMGNHFHLLIRVKEEDEIGFIPSKNESSVSYEPPSWDKKTTDRKNIQSQKI